MNSFKKSCKYDSLIVIAFVVQQTCCVIFYKYEDCVCRLCLFDVSLDVIIYVNTWSIRKFRCFAINLFNFYTKISRTD